MTYVFNCSWFGVPTALKDVIHLRNTIWLSIFLHSYFNGLSTEAQIFSHESGNYFCEKCYPIPEIREFFYFFYESSSRHIPAVFIFLSKTTKEWLGCILNKRGWFVSLNLTEIAKIEIPMLIAKCLVKYHKRESKPVNLSIYKKDLPLRQHKL